MSDLKLNVCDTLEVTAIFTNDRSLAESVTKTLPVGKVEENKESQVQKDEGKVSVDTAAEDSEQKEAAKREVADQPFTSDQSESFEQPADTAEEPEPLVETASNTE